MEELRKKHPERVPVHATRTPEGSTHYFIWSPEDVCVLRSEHRICGLLTGTLPLIPQQNVFLGLPLQLFYEEVAWLLKHDAGMLIDDEEAHRPATSSQIAQRSTAYHQDVERQREEALEMRRKTREARGLPQPAEEAPVPYYHTTPGASTEPWFNPTPDFSHLPETPKTVVFDDLHAKGYYLALGLRFGGDFTVYPGDPLRYHAHYSCQVATGPSSGLELVASGRLGTAVKKSHLIAHVIQGGGVEYFSLAWAGFGT